MVKLRYLLYVAMVAFLISLSFDAIVMSSYWLAPNPQYAFSLGGAVPVTDTFIFGKPDEQIIGVEIEGILFSGTSVTGTVEHCSSTGAAPCTTIYASMVFDGGLDTYSISSTINADSTLKWTTVDSTSPGYLFVTFRYFPTGS